MLPSPAEIANRDARRLAQVLREVGGAGGPVGGGWMACDVPGSWANYAAGLGVHGAVEGPELDRLVAWYSERDAPARVQITPYQHPSLLEGLSARGFVVEDLETVLARDLRDLPSVASDLRFEPVSDRRFVDPHLRGFFPDGDAPGGLVPIAERVVRAERCRLWLLRDGEAVVGSGGLEVFESSAVLIAGSVLREARGRGHQSAFVRFRLQAAKADGRDYAVVASTPGGPTERNALRAGFSVAYTQVQFIRR